jgi:hypothetical protein
LLTEPFTQALGNDAHCDVSDTTRPIRNEDADGPIRIAGLRVGRQ